MNLDSLVRALMSRPIYQRVFLALTLGLFLSCSMEVAHPEPEQAWTAVPAATP